MMEKSFKECVTAFNTLPTRLAMIDPRVVQSWCLSVSQVADELTEHLTKYQRMCSYMYAWESATVLGSIEDLMLSMVAATRRYAADRTVFYTESLELGTMLNQFNPLADALATKLIGL